MPESALGEQGAEISKKGGMSISLGIKEVLLALAPAPAAVAVTPRLFRPPDGVVVVFGP